MIIKQANVSNQNYLKYKLCIRYSTELKLLQPLNFVIILTKS